MHHHVRRRLLAVPIIGLTALLAVPVMAAADQGGNSNGGRKGATTVPGDQPVTTAGDDGSGGNEQPQSTPPPPPPTTATETPESSRPGRGRGNDQPPAGENPNPTPAPPTVRPPESSEAPGSDQSHGTSADSSRWLGQLNELTAKVTASSLSDGDKAALVAAIDQVRQSLASGTVKPADLAALKAIVKAALDHRTSGSSTTTGANSSLPPASSEEPDGSTTSAPAAGQRTDGRRGRPTGKAAVSTAIQIVTDSPLSDDLKTQILGVLNQAKTVLDDTTLTPEQVREKVRELFEAEKAQRLAQAAAKLTRFSEKIATLAFDAASLPGSSAVITLVHDKLAAANAMLEAGPQDIATIKSAWKLLHEARVALQQFLELAGAATTTTTPTTTPDASTTSTTEPQVNP